MCLILPVPTRGGLMSMEPAVFDIDVAAMQNNELLTLLHVVTVARVRHFKLNLYCPMDIYVEPISFRFPCEEATRRAYKFLADHGYSVVLTQEPDGGVLCRILGLSEDHFAIPEAPDQTDEMKGDNAV